MENRVEPMTGGLGCGAVPGEYPVQHWTRHTHQRPLWAAAFGLREETRETWGEHAN